MNAEAQGPDLISSVLAYTSEVVAARPWGIVTGSGQSPEEALRALCHNAAAQGQAIFKSLWEQSSQHQRKDKKCKRLSRHIR